MKIKQLNESNEAIRVSYYGGNYGSNETLSDVYISSEEIRLTLKRIPTELKIRDNRKSIYDDDEYYYRLRDAVKVLKQTNESEADRINKMLFEIQFDDSNTKSEAELHKELDEFITHITTYFKSRLLQFSHDLAKEKEERRNKVISTVTAELKKHGAL